MAEPLEVSVDISDALSALDNLAPDIEKEIMISAKEWLTDVQRLARMKHRHRYVTHTGRLEKSVQVEVGKTIDEGGRAYLEIGIAHYGPFVHEGQRSWKPDQFLYSAAEALRPELDPKINQSIQRATDKFNKGK